MSPLAGGGRPPSVDRIARRLSSTGLPAPLRVLAARRAVADAMAAQDPASVWARAQTHAAAEQRRLLQPVINATGVILHTNLGRAPFGVALEAGYTNLELDLGSGRRGDRGLHAGRLLAQACGAEAATVVNNGAAAVLLVLATLAAGREVIVSRGELIEIGGGFRLPEVLASSGAELVEVGTTNRTRLDDYAGSLSPRTGAVLKVHTSNYRITGFTQASGVAELAAMAAAGDSDRAVESVPLVVDIGSGLLDAACPWLAGGPPDWLRDEPAARQTLAAGASIVTFSGDKLLGGPQAGVIAGRAALVERCQRHPLARALRPGGMVLEALQQAALAYLRRDAGETLPLWRLAACSVDALRRRAADLGVGEVVDCQSVMGGGALPGRTIPSAGVALAGDQRARLLSQPSPVLARVVDGRTICDLRTVFPEQDELLAKALSA